MFRQSAVVECPHNGAHLRERLARLPAGLGFRLRDPSQLRVEELLRMDAGFAAAVGLGLTDPIRAADFNTLTLPLGPRAGEPLRVAGALLLEAAFVASRGHSARRRAFSILDRVTPVAEEVADQALDGWALGTSALVHYWMGEFVDAGPARTSPAS